MMNVLVVGGAGYVGGAVTDLLSPKDYRVRVFDNLLYEDTFRKPVDFAFGDVRDEAALRPHLDWADAVVWLAAIVGDGACELDPDRAVSVNEEAVRALSENYGGRIVFVSTCSVYGAQDAELDESSPLKPLSVYAATKLKAESFLADRNAVILRLGTLFGVGDLFARIRMDLVVNTLTVRAATQGRISVFGGEQFRPLLHVRDVARAIEASLSGAQRGVFNLARENVRIIDLAKMIRVHFPICAIEVTDLPFQDLRNYRVSCRKATEAFGFASVHSIDDGIEEVKSLVATKRVKDIDHIRYSNHRFLGTAFR
jgi:nucleoside-diphosphate-sugar epimerase